MRQDAGTADIIGTLGAMNRGNFIIAAGNKLAELNNAIIDTGGKGTITIKLEIEPSGRKDGRVNQFEIKPSVTISKPEHPQGKSLFFVSETGKLTRDDPDQFDLELDDERNIHARK